MVELFMVGFDPIPNLIKVRLSSSPTQRLPTLADVERTLAGPNPVEGFARLRAHRF